MQHTVGGVVGSYRYSAPFEWYVNNQDRDDPVDLGINIQTFRIGNGLAAGTYDIRQLANLLHEALAAPLPNVHEGSSDAARSGTWPDVAPSSPHSLDTDPDDFDPRGPSELPGGSNWQSAFKANNPLPTLTGSGPNFGDATDSGGDRGSTGSNYDRSNDSSSGRGASNDYGGPTSAGSRSSNDNQSNYEEAAYGGSSSSSSGSSSHYRDDYHDADDDRGGSDTPSPYDNSWADEVWIPIILDLDQNGIEITQYSESTQFMVGEDGLLHRTAWAGAGDGVLFYDPGNSGQITETRQFVFTEWDPTASSDIEALKNVFDSNGDGVFDANDAAWSDFKVMVSNADGSTSAVTLASLGITSIDLDVDATNIVLPDGSVITGQTEFTYSNGTTGLVGDVMLAVDGEGYDVEEIVSTDGSGNRVVEQTGYAADGAVAFVVTSVTSPDGSAINNAYDNNGDGVVDRVQTIDLVTNPDGSTVRTATNYAGSAVATGVLANQTVTNTSADGTSVTIQRDSQGGGWFDQIETRTEQVDGSWLNVTHDLAKDGTIIASISETVSADGLTRSEAIDEDGDGSVDLTINHVIVVNPDGSRHESVTTNNGDWSLRASMTEAISADGRTKTVTHDYDGNGNIDEIVETVLTVNPDGSTSSSIIVKNGDGTVRSSGTQDQSADTRTKTINTDLDGDGDVDATRVEQAIINPDGSREETVTVTNLDGSINSMVKETLGADKISGQTWVDLNENGTFEATDLARDVSVDGVTGDVTATDYVRNDDGSLRSQVTNVTSADGLTSTQSIDADGDGDTDTLITETTSVNGSGEAITVAETRNQDGTLRSKSTSTTSADGLTTTVAIDADGNGALDQVITTVLTNNPDGSITTLTETYAGDGTTVLNATQTDQSADRRSTTVSIDEDGDGNLNRVEQIDQALDGARTVLTTTYHDDGSVASTVSSSISADGLSTSSNIDSDGDGIVETSTQSDTVLNSDGSRATTIIISNGDGSERSRTFETISDDGLAVTLESDADGDGVFESKTVSTTTLNLDGSQTVRAEQFAADGTSLSVIETETNDDGLVVTVRTDSDSDGTFDLVSVATTTLLADGGRETIEELRDAAGVLRSSIKTSVSDDGELTIVERDVDGDGLIDEKETQTIQDDGTVEAILEQLALDGSLQSVRKTVTSDDGLVVTTSLDRTGDGVFETVQIAITVLNADGSTTTTSQTLADDGTIIDRIITSASDDGLTTNRQEDWDNDGDFDGTYAEQTTLNVDGSVTQVSRTDAANGDVLAQTTQVTSADGRTVTTNQNADGNGVDDAIMSWTLADDGSVTEVADYFTEGGILEASFTSISSGDGLTVQTYSDRNGDGEDDLIIFDKTNLAPDGSTSRFVDYRDDRYVKLAREEYAVHDDGLYLTMALDIDGDDIMDFVTTDATTLNADGSISQLVASYGSSGNLLSELATTISGDGLSEIAMITIGSEQIDRTVTMIAGADGGYTETGEGTGANWETVLSADSRTQTTKTDMDSDGQLDWSMGWNINADQSVTHTYQDLGAAGVVESSITSQMAANGQSQHVSLDVDGDGASDIIRTRDVTFDAAGNQNVTITETYANGSLAYHEVQMTSADGNLITRQVDQDGDGVVDGTTTTTITLNDDGSQETKIETRYADGELRESSVETVSADGRTITSERDYDGNGIADKKTVLEIRSDGEQVLTETTFSEAGVSGTIFVTTTSADGLLQTIVRDGNIQTITRSPLDNGSYTWDNGSGLVVDHKVDGAGVETWSDGTTTVILDADRKARIIDEAARIYDTLLDRDMDFTEVETLLIHIDDGELDREGLSAQLLNSGEFTTRYGSMSDAEFVSQLFLNSYGRTASLDDMVECLTKLGGQVSRAELTMSIAESAEHHFVGNVHRSTNNYDVMMNPAQAERVLDKSAAVADVGKLVQTMFDRDPNAYELEYYTEKLLDGTSDPVDLIGEMMGVSDDGPNSLSALDGVQLVNQAFFNALGLPPTVDEIDLWTDLIGDGTVTEADFVFLLSMSTEADAAEQAHGAGLPADLQEINGTSGNNTINGTGAAELITGGQGNDTMDGKAGSDTYVWAKGDGNDVINDTSTSLAETDRLVLTDVQPDDVRLYHTTGGDDLRIEIISTGEEIRISNWYSDEIDGRGIEELKFADGTIWTVDDILTAASVTGTNSGDTISGYEKDENLFGLNGSDTISGRGGDDTIVGGSGNDELRGGRGSDTFIWSIGDGEDFIFDGTISITDIDTLILTNVASSDVKLSRTSSDDLRVTIVSTGERLQIDDQFYRNPTPDWGGGRAVTYGKGIERIEMADGALWTLEDIYEVAVINGDTSGNTINGTSLHDNIFANDGNDTVYGLSGDDRIEGGLGEDRLEGGDGADTYVWSKGDGNDTIDDAAVSKSETDKLVLTDVTADDVKLSRSNGADRLDITIISTGEVIKVSNQFNQALDGKGLEEIHFADGSVWNLLDIQSRTRVEGDNSANTLTGHDGRDNLYGYGGNDTLDGEEGDDKFVGGAGNDTLFDEGGNDLYVWAKGDGNDFIDDEGQSFNETDTLRLVDVNQTGATLTKDGEDLLVTIDETGEIIRVDERFRSATANEGVELIAYADGIVTEILASEAATASHTGTIGSDTISGWGFVDIFHGGDGNDTLHGYRGDDIFYGEKGNDTLYGGEDSDTYYWSKGDGNDWVWDEGLSGTDTLHLTDVLPDDVSLIRHISPTYPDDDLKITVGSTGEVVNVLDYFDASREKGVEKIVFGDGTIWLRADIEANTRVEGNSSNNTLNGLNGYGDNLFGLAGNDLLRGYSGDDWLEGGTGADTLEGGAGNDTYVWSIGDGNDYIDDRDGSISQIDTLILTDLLPADIKLTRVESNMDMYLEVIPSGETIHINDHYNINHRDRGVEHIEFADGTVWDRATIEEEAVLEGNSGNNDLDGRDGFRDNIYGHDGNDTIHSEGGDDFLYGGLGVDSLHGGEGSDTYVWSKGDASGQYDQIWDRGSSGFDVLELTDVTPDDVHLVRYMDPSYPDDDVHMTIVSTGETIRLLDQFKENTTRGVEQIKFADGTEWDFAEIGGNTITQGNSGNNNLKGLSDVDDYIFGFAGNDTLKGRSGDDILVGGAGADHLDGDGGADWASYETSSVGLTVNFANRSLNTGDAAGDSYETVENIRGSAFGDFLTGDGNSNSIEGGDGDDTLSGGGGGDYLEGGDGHDTASYQSAGSAIVVDLLNPGLNIGDAAGDVLVNIEDIVGSNHADTISGDANDNRINGGDGADILYGGDGNDTLDAGAGSSDPAVWQELRGEGGDDTYVISANSGSVRIDASAEGVSTGSADRIVFSDIDTVDFDFSLTTNNELLFVWDNGVESGQLMIADADDYIESFEFADGSGFSAVSFDGNGDPIIYGTAGNDYVIGTTAFDTFVGSSGADYYHGGAGFDRVDYQASASGVTVNTITGLGYGGDAEGDQLTSIAAIYGSDFDDTFTGNSYFYGHDGNDTFNDASGNATLIGGDGDDLYIFGDISGNDTLWGFGANGDFDRIDLTAVSDITDFNDLLANHVTQDGNHVLIDMGGTDTLRLAATDITDLSDSDFVF